MLKQNVGVHLPKIIGKSQLKTLNSSSSRKTLQDYLNSLKLQQLTLKHQQTSRKEQKQKLLLKRNQSYKQTGVKVSRKTSIRKQIDPDQQFKKDVHPTLYVNRIITDWKPPNRYKTAIGISDSRMIVYGGLGCQKSISWSKFSFKNLSWSTPNRNESIQESIYGHSLRIYKGNAYVYGGTRLESSTNELICIQLKSMSIQQLQPAPYRRKEHVMTVISKFIVVHGGLEGVGLTKNTLFYYEIQNNRWFTPMQAQLPSLSHHTMITIPCKHRKRVLSLQDILGQCIFMFGGLNEHSQQTNKLLCLKVKESGEIISEQVVAPRGPEARHSHCMQFLQPNYICVYGGRNNEQLNGLNKKDGVYNDIFLFNIQSKQWIVPYLSENLQFRYGASCCSSKDKLIIFGGNNAQQYADGSIIEISLSNPTKDKKESLFQQRISMVD